MITNDPKHAPTSPPLPLKLMVYGTKKLHDLSHTGFTLKSPICSRGQGSLGELNIKKETIDGYGKIPNV